MDVEKKYKSKPKQSINQYMKKFLKKIIFVSLISFYFFKVDQVKSLVPYYYSPTIKNLQKESLSIGKNAYQLLYFGQYKQSLNLSKLAVKINKTDEKLWLILSEAQVANELYKKAKTLIPGGTMLLSKRPEMFLPDLWPSYFSKSKGCKVWDLDDKELIDMCIMGIGTNTHIN